MRAKHACRNVMGWTKIGYLNNQGNGFQFNPETPLAPILQIPLTRKINDIKCALTGKFESGLRGIGAAPLANIMALNRKLSGCYVGTPPSFEAAPGALPFKGGQCAGIPYGFAVRPSNGGFSYHNLGAPGAIQSAVVKTLGTPGNYQYRLEVVGGNGQLYPKTIGFGSDIKTWIIECYRIDGQADVCGDPPGGSPTYPPAVEPFPPVVQGDTIYEGDKNYVTNIDLGGQTFPMSFEFSPFVFNAGGVEFSLGGIEFKINPDFSIDVGDGNETEPVDLDPISDALDSLQTTADNVLTQTNNNGNQITSVSNELSEVKECVCIPVSGTITGTGCDGTAVPVNYSGEGILGLQQAIELTQQSLNTVILTLCPEPEPPEDLESLPLGTYGGLQRTAYYDVELPANTRYVDIVATTTVAGYSSPASIGSLPNDKQGRFGLVSLLIDLDGDYRVVWTEKQYYPRQRYYVPDRVTEPTAIRVNLYAGSVFELTSYSKV